MLSEEGGRRVQKALCMATGSVKRGTDVSCHGMRAQSTLRSRYRRSSFGAILSYASVEGVLQCWVSSSRVDGSIARGA